jgi:lysophospholipase L1-like esterase
LENIRFVDPATIGLRINLPFFDLLDAEMIKTTWNKYPEDHVHSTADGRHHINLP